MTIVRKNKLKTLPIANRTDRGKCSYKLVISSFTHFSIAKASRSGKEKTKSSNREVNLSRVNKWPRLLCRFETPRVNRLEPHGVFLALVCSWIRRRHGVTQRHWCYADVDIMVYHPRLRPTWRTWMGGAREFVVSDQIIAA
jgi:hypothetical protein